MKDVNVSIVIPVYNEEENVQRLYEELISVLKEKLSFELIFVDDGSTDNSLSILKKITEKDKRIKVVTLISNYGQSNALSAGISKSKGKIIVTMDSDLQHDPNDIIPMIKKIDEGYHVVCGWRKSRGKSDSFVKKTIPSKISNLLIRKLTGVKLKDSTGGMRAFVRKVVETISLYGENHRYLPILAKWKGFKVSEIPINIRKRVFGKTKYNYKRIFRGFLDLITLKFFISYSSKPIHIFGTIGIFSFLLGSLIGLYILILKIFFNIRLLQEVATLLLIVVLMLLGMMFLGFGFIADMISYDAITSQKRDTYIIEKTIEKN